MKSKIIAAATAAALTVGFAATAASAGGPPAGTGDRGKPVGIACMQYGHGILRSLGAPAIVSQEVIGLPLNQVLALHRNNPAAAAGVLVSLGQDPGPCDVH